MAFQLTKTWVDFEPGVEMVEVRYVCSPLGQAPKWEGDDSADVMTVIPNTTPRLRRAEIEVPRYLDDRDSYLLHHRFMYVKGGREQFSPVFTEQIVAQEVPYVDAEGRLTEVRLLWSVNGWSAQNWTKASLEGLDLAADGSPDRREREGEGVADDAMYELIQTVPLPRRYVAKVWGPRGTTVEYVYQLIRANSPLPEDDFQTWDDNQGHHYRLLLG